MADRQKFDGAMNKWRNLHREGNFSAPSGVGDVAVLCSYETRITSPGRFPRTDRRREVRVLRSEAQRIGEYATSVGRNAEVILDFGIDEIKSVLQNPRVSDVIIIGHGGLAEVFIKNNPKRETFDWEDVSQHADHLKQGFFIQRHCGGYNRELSAPLGMFAVSDFSHVHAAPGFNIKPDNPEHPDHALIRPVFGNGVEPTYTSIKDNFPYTPRTNSHPLLLPPPNATDLIR